jgi:predicted 3-demethylubiquinone-9 3-methyltransferase (glyoxalase superfamily)
MSNNLYPCLWFDGKISEATHFYCSLFENSKVHAQNNIISKFEIEGTIVKLLNGGALFNINPSISFFVKFNTKAEIDKIWNAMLDGGKVMMALNTYPWSSYYGWIQDKYGMTWQFFEGNLQVNEQKIIPSMLFTNNVFGRAQEAVNFYTKVFTSSKINFIDNYTSKELPNTGKLKFGSFQLNNQQFAAMDGPGNNHAFQFNEGVSYILECDTQEQIDYYWEALSSDGFEGQCGWLKDKFGVSWQIIPIQLNQLMSNPETANKAREAFMKMNKFIIKDLF